MSNAYSNEILKQIDELAPLADSLRKAQNIDEKLHLLDGFERVRQFLQFSASFESFLHFLSSEELLVFKSLIALRQVERIFSNWLVSSNDRTPLKQLLQSLLTVESFYAELGGIVGYHLMMLRFLCSKSNEDSFADEIYYPADGVDISKEAKEVGRAIFWGIEKMPEMAEIYPVGGAADRLRLQDEKTGMGLPAAKLLFLGKTLLEGMIRDLQAREYVYYKLKGQQLITPVAMMTSLEKDNHSQILSICEEKKWFGRSKESFRFFCQPSVPTMNREGKWCLQASMQLLLKPGGHGVIWKLARDKGIFDWLFLQNKRKALIRQINNPIAGCDHGLFALIGLGCEGDKLFGFASCPREMKANEGVNVLIERQKKGAYEYVLSNIEYCDFAKFKFFDEQSTSKSQFGKLSSNTNILFVDLKAVLDAVSLCPIPGMLVNLKKTAYRNEIGEIVEEEIARLESTMQNIADCFTERYQNPLKSEKKFLRHTFLTFNERHKTISTPKREFILGSSLLETPEGCFLDFLKNVRELLLGYCHMEVPEVSDPMRFFIEGPSFICFYHPALGPIYSIIAQKIQGGRLARGSELQLEIAELLMRDLHLDGSLRIQAHAVLGHFSSEGLIKYSEHCGKCTLKNVKVCNRGIDRDAANVFWRNEIFREQSCFIEIHGNGEFYAENISLQGDLHIVVENGTLVTAYEEEGRVHFRKQLIKAPTWQWEYSWDEDFQILVSYIDDERIMQRAKSPPHKLKKKT
ncbi:MAG: UTP--glucose-1-phosphate uridylyltransferase [Anaerolineae bacterium]